MPRTKLLALQLLVAVVAVVLWHVRHHGADRRGQAAAAVLLLDAG